MKLKQTYILFFSGSLLLAFLNKAEAQTYCTPIYTYTPYGCSDGDEISGVVINGANSTTLNNTGTACSVNAYGDYTNLTPPDLILGSTYTGSISTDYPSPTYEDARAWIDYNNDGTFSSSEEIATINGFASSGTSAISFTVPLTASPGLRRMRVRLVYSTSNIDPCSSYTFGETEDYTVHIVPLAPPDNAGVDSLLNPAIDGIFCSGEQEVKVRVRNLGVNPIHSLQVNWSIDGVLQPPVSYNSVIDSIYSSTTNFAIVSLGVAQFPYNTPVEIKSWTSMPNGVPDNDNSDDTLTQVVTSVKQGIILSIQPQDTTICTGMSVTLDAGAFPSGPLYVWNTGAITRTIHVTDGGDYYVKVMNNTGCEARDTVHVTVNPSPSAAAVSAIDLGGGDFSFGAIAAENVDTYEWDFGDNTGLQTGPPPMPHHYTTAGVYAVTLTLINDCGGVTISKQVNVEQVTGIPETNVLNHAISMYPNPAHNEVTLQAQDGLRIHAVAFYDLLGRKVYAATVNGSKALINTAVLPAGFYQVVIDTDKGRLSKKLAVGK